MISYKFSDYFAYIEMFILITMTVGPYSEKTKIVVFVGLLAINYKYVLKCSNVPCFWLLLLFSMALPMIWDIRNIDLETPYSLASFAFITPFVTCYFYNKKYSYSKFLSVFERVAFFTVICSLLGMFLIYFMPQLVQVFPLRQYYHRKIHTIIFFNAVEMSPGVFSKRNYGVAFEPGAYQFIINLGVAILFTNIKNYKISYLVSRLLVYAFALLLTRSTTGLIIFALLVAVNSIRTKRGFLAVLMIALLTSGFLRQTILFQMNKMASGSEGNVASRFNNSIYVIQNYSGYVLGIGSTGYNKEYRVNKSIGSWDVYTNLYLRFGLFFLVLFLYMNLRVMKLNKNLFIVIALTLLTESLIGPIAVMIYTYAINPVDGLLDVVERD